MMKRLRQQRKDAGLVELDNVWVTPKQRDCLKDLSRQIVDYPNPVLKSPLSVLLE